MTDEQFEIVIKKLDEILKRIKGSSKKETAGTITVNIRDDVSKTSNEDWNKVRGQFQRANRKYPDWITVFVKAKDAQGLYPGCSITVEGNLREGESKTGKPIFSIFADKFEILQQAEQPEADIEQFNAGGNVYDEAPF